MAIAISSLDGVREKVEAGERLDFEDGLALMESDDLRALHDAMPDVHLKLYTASEIHHMSKLSGLTHEEVLRELKDAGLGSLPGGGAEIFADRVRRLIAPGKEPAEEWFDVHDSAHRM